MEQLKDCLEHQGYRCNAGKHSLKATRGILSFPVTVVEDPATHRYVCKTYAKAIAPVYCALLIFGFVQLYEQPDLLPAFAIGVPVFCLVSLYLTVIKARELQTILDDLPSTALRETAE